MVSIDTDAIRRASVADRVRRARDIWDSLQPIAEKLPVTEAQEWVIRERLGDHEADPSTAIAWTS